MATADAARVSWGRGAVCDNGPLWIGKPPAFPSLQTLHRELAALRQSVAMPMVLVTHDLHEARRLADRMVILEGGESPQTGPPARVFASPRNARVAALVGVQNHFRGRFFRSGAEDAPGFGQLVWHGDASGMRAARGAATGRDQFVHLSAGAVAVAAPHAEFVERPAAAAGRGAGGVAATAYSARGGAYHAGAAGLKQAG